METVTIVARKRDRVGSRQSRVLRKSGLIPAVLYGHGMDPVPLALSAKELIHCVRQGSRVVTIDLEGERDQAVLKELQWDPFGRDLVHADFLRVRMDEEVTVTVPLEAAGVPRGLEAGGTLETYRAEARIRCLPGRIPETISYDVSGLDVNQVFHLKNIALPEGVSIDEDPETVVAAVVSKTETPVEEAAPEGEGEGAEGAEAEGAGAEERDEDES